MSRGLPSGGDVFPALVTHAPVSKATWTEPLGPAAFSLGEVSLGSVMRRYCGFSLLMPGLLDLPWGAVTQEAQRSKDALFSQARNMEH